MRFYAVLYICLFLKKVLQNHDALMLNSFKIHIEIQTAIIVISITFGRF